MPRIMFCTFRLLHLLIGLYFSNGNVNQFSKSGKVVIYLGGNKLLFVDVNLKVAIIGSENICH